MPLSPKSVAPSASQSQGKQVTSVAFGLPVSLDSTVRPLGIIYIHTGTWAERLKVSTAGLAL